MLRAVVVRFQFEGFHRWAGATGEHAYLSSVHRHMFHVRAVRPVQHNDRDIEFIKLKRDMQFYCLDKYGRCPTEYSCEHMAEALVKQFGLSLCEVSEDGENGGLIMPHEDDFRRPTFPEPVTVTVTAGGGSPPQSTTGCAGPEPQKPKKDMKFDGGMFVGIEAEGPSTHIRGTPTLFIPASWSGSMSDLRAAIALFLAAKTIKCHLYVGASDDNQNYNEEMLRQIKLIMQQMTVSFDRIIFEVECLENLSESILSEIEGISNELRRQTKGKSTPYGGRFVLVTRTIEDCCRKLASSIGFTWLFYKTVNEFGIRWIPITTAHTTHIRSREFERDTPIEEYFETGLRDVREVEEETDEECDE